MHLAKYRSAAPDENCHGIGTGFCLNFARRAPGRAGLFRRPGLERLHVHLFGKADRLSVRARTTASTAPSSGARSTPSAPRWCRATRPPCWRTATSIFPAMLEAIGAARDHRSTSRCTSSTTTRSDARSPGLSPSGRGRASRCASSSTDSGSPRRALEGQLEKAGAQVRVYKPLRIYSIDTIGNRTHRRILTVDGRIGFCGGVGIDDRWKGTREPGMARDDDRGGGARRRPAPAVFAQDWVHTTGEVLNGDRQFPAIAPAGDMLAQVIAASRADSISMSKLVLYMAIQAARKTHLDRERLLRAGPPDPPGPRGRGQTRRRRARHRAGRAHRQPQRPRGLALPLRRAPGRRRRRSTSTGRR